MRLYASCDAHRCDGVLQQVGRVLRERGFDLLDAGVHQADRADDDGRNRFVAIGDGTHDFGMSGVFPDVVFIHRDTGGL